MAGRRSTDRTAGWLGVGVLVLVLASEAALTLPDENAAPAAVAAFYRDHRVAIVALQVAGLAASGLLAALAVRLRRVNRAARGAGLLLAAATAAPSIVTLLTAAVADPAHPARAGSLNRLEPLADDVLFAAVLLLAGVLATSGRRPRSLAALAAVTAVCCALRLGLAAAGRPRGPLDTLAPLSFLALLAALTVWSFLPPQRLKGSPDFA